MLWRPNRLRRLPSLYKCLASTNLIESPQSCAARQTGNVSTVVA